MKERISYYHTATSIQNTHTQKKTLSKKSSKQNTTHTHKEKKERKISVYGTEEEDPEGEAVEDGGRTMAEQIKASVSKGVDKVKLM